MFRSLFIFIAVFGVMPLLLVWPHLGILVWSWISYMNPHRLTYGIAYSFNFLDYVGGATVLAAILTREPKGIPNHPLVYLLLIYLGWVTLTSFFAVEQTLGWEKWLTVVKIFLFTFLTLMFMNTKVRIHALLWVIVLSIGFFSTKGGVFTLLTAGASRVWGPEGTFFADNNFFGLVAVMLVPIIRYLHMQATNKHLKWVLLGMGCFTLLSIFGTQSRGAFLALFCMLFFLVLKSKKRILGIVALIFSLAIGIVFMPESWRARMETTTNYEQDASAQGRLTMWKFAIDVANDHPVLGGGYDVFYNDAYRARYLPFDTQGRAVHSAYFEVLGEHGYVGLILFLLIGMTTYFTCSIIIARTRGDPEMHWYRDLASMIQVSIVGYAVASVFLNTAIFDFYYHLIAITAILRVKSDKELAAREEKANETAFSRTPHGRLRNPAQPATAP